MVSSAVSADRAVGLLAFKDTLVVPGIKEYVPWPADRKKIVAGVKYNLPAKAEVRADHNCQTGQFELTAVPIFGPSDDGEFLPGVSVMERAKGVDRLCPGFHLVGLQHGFCLDNHTGIFPDNLPEDAYFILAGTVIHLDESLSEPGQEPVPGEDHAIPYFSLDKDYDEKGKVVLATVWRRKWFHLRLRFPRNGFLLCASRVD